MLGPMNSATNFSGAMCRIAPGLSKLCAICVKNSDHGKAVAELPAITSSITLDKAIRTLFW